MPEMTIAAAQEREDGYAVAQQAIAAVLEGETNMIARMATIVSILSQSFPDRYFWAGFYILDEAKSDELVVGPYQGTLGCLRIKFGQGICGIAAESRETQIVADVHSHKNHIACDSNSMSEIVVPVFDASGALIAVFDVDSTRLADFDETDKTWLESIMRDSFSK